MSQGVRVGHVDRQCRRIQRDRHVTANGHQLFRQARGVRQLQQRFTRSFLRHLGGVRKNLFERPELRDEFLRGFFADALHARYVVRCVTDHREIVDHSLRRHAEAFTAVLDAHPRLFDTGRSTTSRIEQPDTRTHQLLEVFVARHDHHVVAQRHALQRQRTNDIVGLEARYGHHRDVIGGQQLRDPLEATIEVGLQFVGQFFARRFVVGIEVITKGGTRVMHPPEQLGFVSVQQSLEKIGDAPGRRRVLTPTGGERTSEQRKKRAIDQRVTIDQKETRGGWSDDTHGCNASLRRMALSSSERADSPRRHRPKPV